MPTQYLTVSPEQYNEHHQAMDYFRSKADYDSAIAAIQQLLDSGYINQPWNIQKQFLNSKNSRLGELAKNYNNIDELSQVLQLSQTVKQRPVIQEQTSKEPIANQIALKQTDSPKKYATYVYDPEGNLYAQRTWTDNNSGVGYIITDGMSIDSILKDSWNRNNLKYSDSEFFNRLGEITGSQGQYKIKSGDYRKPGKVYLKEVSQPEQILYQKDWYYPNNSSGWEHSTFMAHDDGTYHYDEKTHLSKQEFQHIKDSLNQYYSTPVITKSDTTWYNGVPYIIQEREFIRKQPEINKNSQTSTIQTTPQKIKGVLNGIKNLFGFKQGGTINYLKHFKI